MTLTAPVVDAEGAVLAWAASLSLKAALTPQRSGADYLLLSRVGGTPDELAGLDHARITAEARSFKSKQAALNLAVKFANAVWALTSGQIIAAGVMCFTADVESGPTEIRDPSGTSRYLVVTQFHLGAVAS